MKSLSNIILIGTVFLIIGCDDVFEEDITDTMLTTTSPKNQDVINGNSVQFRWEELDGTESYRIQVTEESTQKNVLDSLVGGNSFTYSLSPGNYSWRARGENFAYQTVYTFPVTFNMVASGDLSIQEVFLISPSEYFYTNKNSMILTWNKISAATFYGIEIDETSQGSTVTRFQQNDLSSNNFTLEPSVLSKDAIYTWKIKAFNENSESKFSIRKIFLDTEIPSQPNLQLPEDDDTSSSTVDFSWNLGIDSGEVQSTLSSVLEIADDLNFSNIIQSYETDLTTQQNVFSTTGEYYWRVQVIDAAGNESIMSETRKITVE